MLDRRLDPKAMTKGKPNPKSRSTSDPSLRAQVYEQELKLLEMANKSPNPAIQEYALKAAAEDRKHIQRQEARLSTRAAVGSCCVTWTVGLGLSWFAIVHYRTPIHGEILSAICAVCVILTLIFLASAKLIEAKVVVEFLRSLWNKFVVRKEPESQTEDGGA
jgi:hypothetical protein